MSRDMLIANDGCSYQGGSCKMWMGFCAVINFVVSPGQMRVILVVTVENAEVSIHIYGAIDEGMLML